MSLHLRRPNEGKGTSTWTPREQENQVSHPSPFLDFQFTQTGTGTGPDGTWTLGPLCDFVGRQNKKNECRWIFLKDEGREEIGFV